MNNENDTLSASNNDSPGCLPERLSKNSAEVSEQKIKSIYSAAPIGIGVVKERIFTEVNNYFCQMTGYQADELIGNSSRMLYPSDEEFEFVGSIKYAQIAELGIGSLETNWLKKDGSVMHIVLNSTPIDIDDFSQGFTFTAIDITYSKIAQEHLLQSYASLTDVIDSIPSGLFVYQYKAPDQLLLVSGNRQAEIIFDNKIHFSIGRDFRHIWKNADSYGLTEKLLSAVRTGKNLKLEEVEYEDEHISGIFKFVVFNMPGKRLGVAIEDLTKIKLAEKKTKESETKLTKLIDNSFDSIYIIQDRKFSYANAQLCKLTGYDLSEITSPDFDFTNLFSLEGQIIIENRLETRKKGEEPPNNFETQIISKSGAAIDVEISSVSIGFSEETVVMGIMRDITNRKVYFEELSVSHSTYLGIINSLSEAVYILNDKGEFMFVNDAAEKLYGYDRDLFIGKTP